MSEHYCVFAGDWIEHWYDRIYEEKANAGRARAQDNDGDH